MVQGVATLYCCLAVEIWDRQASRSGATVHSDHVTTTTTSMMMEDERLVSKMEGKTNFSRRIQAVRNGDCWMFGTHWRMDGVIWNSLMAWTDWPWLPYFTSDLRHCMLPCILHPRRGSSPWNFTTTVALKNVPTRWWKVWRYVHSFSYTIRVWRTDGLICHNSVALCMPIGTLTRDKNHDRNKLCGRPPQYTPATCKLTFWPWKWCTSHVWRVTFVPILVYLGFSVLDLGPMYATDVRQTDRHQTRIIA